MDKKSLIGFGLLLVLFFVWMKINTPSQKELDAKRRTQDSIAMALKNNDSTKIILDTLTKSNNTNSDSLKTAAQQGPFLVPAQSAESDQILENDVFRVVFTNKGGRIKEVTLKRFNKLTEDQKGVETKHELKLLEDKKNKFEYLLPVSGASSAVINTGDLIFDARKEGQTIVFTANTADGGFFEQKYTIAAGSYNIDYEVNLHNLAPILDRNAKSLQLTWVNYLDKLEINHKYERNYSSVYFKTAEKSPDHCKCTDNDVENIENKPVKWISHVNQFFNTSLIADQSFKGAKVETVMLDPENEDLKRINSEIQFPLAQGDNSYKMKLYSGPNEFKILQSYDQQLEDIIPYGSNIMGTINRWIIRPIFDGLQWLVGNPGIVILLLTLIVKLCLYPLTYKMLHSQAKMNVLKPQIATLRKKHGDDQQAIQMETMKLYREWGVNPLGGCLPMVLQMPIWFALYRFFPAAIDFRQASFLWANDLSSYDAVFRFSSSIPLLGNHLSLFTILWTISTIGYTWYNSKNMDMSAMGNQKMMMYMQYLMPIFAIFFFNNTASGLTCYLVFSTILNILQTVITKKYIINDDKIKLQLEKNKSKPKKKGGFQERLEQALKDQQRLAQEKNKNNK